jgi:predicted DNA-binding protein
MAKQPTKTIAFRLHESLEARLATEAAERQLSVGEYVRQIVINELSNDKEKSSAAVEALAETVKRLEMQFREVVVELLINAGHAEPHEALDWVRTKLGGIEP